MERAVADSLLSHTHIDEPPLKGIGVREDAQPKALTENCLMLLCCNGGVVMRTKRSSQNINLSPVT